MTAANHPARFESPSGLRVEMNANGSIRRIDHGEILLNLFLGSEIEGGPTNIYVRRGGGTIDSTPLLGPSSPGCVDLDERGLTIHGEWKDL
ncbi:MAG: hypothetical protein HY270_02235, partial [Deltaproteobacteria bacterium]|nr:hypothetical protein [Deltaproteobacteria bacterium]